MNWSSRTAFGKTNVLKFAVILGRVPQVEHSIDHISKEYTVILNSISRKQKQWTSSILLESNRIHGKTIFSLNFIVLYPPCLTDQSHLTLMILELNTYWNSSSYL